MAEVRDTRALDLAWFSDREQHILQKSIRESQITRKRVFNMISLAWEELNNAVDNNRRYPECYSPPPLKIRLEQTFDEQRRTSWKSSGLGDNLYPIGDQFKQWALEASQEERDLDKNESIDARVVRECEKFKE